ncbi:MAG: excisionase family DNA-binding protein [Hyphomicrobiaceae bacterium]
MNDARPYSVKTLAERWGCSVDTIYDLIAKGRLPAFRAGGRLLRISARAVERWESAEGQIEGAGIADAPSMATSSASGKVRREKHTAEYWASMDLGSLRR